MTENPQPIGYLSPNEAARATSGLSAGKVAVITGPETLEPRVGVYLHPMPAAAIGSGVKALEWEQITDAHIATSEIGTYEVLQFPPFGSDQLLVRLKGLNPGGLPTWFATIDEAKAAAQADFERRVLSCLSTHTAAGAGPVGEAVAWTENAKALLELNEKGAVTHPVPGLAVSLLRKAIDLLAARPVDKPGEVERLTRERDCLAEAIAEAATKAGIVRADAGGLSGPQLMMLADDLASAGLATEAALAESEQNAQGLASDLAGTQAELAETRERLEKVETIADAAEELLEVSQLRGETDYVEPCDDPGLWTARRNDAWSALEEAVDARAALTVDAQEAVR